MASHIKVVITREFHFHGFNDISDAIQKAIELHSSQEPTSLAIQANYVTEDD